MNRTDLQTLADTRLREAKVLFEAAEYSGAYYLAGYSVECALKACIAKATRQFDFPDKRTAQQAHTHSLEDLIRVANLNSERKKRMAEDEDFEVSWEAVKNWSEESRYKEYSQKQAKELLAAIDGNEYGVLAWLKHFW